MLTLGQSSHLTLLTVVETAGAVKVLAHSSSSNCVQKEHVCKQFGLLSTVAVGFKRRMSMWQVCSVYDVPSRQVLTGTDRHTGSCWDLGSSAVWP